MCRRLDIRLNNGSNVSISDTRDQMKIQDVEMFLALYLLEFPTLNTETQAHLVFPAFQVGEENKYFDYRKDKGVGQLCMCEALITGEEGSRFSIWWVEGWGGCFLHSSILRSRTSCNICTPLDAREILILRCFGLA